MKPSPELNPSRRQLLLAIAGGAALSACGGGDSGEALSEQPNSHPLGIGAGGTGIVRSSFLSAAINAVGPINVGGVQLATGGALLTDGDGQSLRENEIEPGMTARVRAGQIITVAGRNLALAKSLEVDTQLRGEATWLDAQTAIILGQRVKLPPSVPGLSGIGAGGTGRNLRVWGQLDLARSQVVASRVALARPGDTDMLRGLLSGIDRAAGTVQVGSLQAYAADAAMLPAGLELGAVVRLVVGAARADGSLALLVLREDAVRPPEGSRVELEGRVTQFSSAQRFALDGVAVDASQAVFEGLANLAVGAEASVSGKMSGGLLVAREVHAQAAEPLEFSGRIDALDVLRQTINVGGMLLHWSSTTRFVSSSAKDLRVGRQLAGLARWVPGQAALEASRLSVEK
ncbi:DUF5666 domain-containing protein [Paucibacter sp. B2R-40]|uniref:DUF5666 domain-containing protein n=1 Tax=Paucibacter sp. B2R-40 TaxID=2893554 RepID=UPI0021E4E5B2|nr:DUF5666 domain-containing protein [Paucibacter sp. B2R-40]MCV2354764.1 DUF5666 domain-containing protein [Paucibacter sp. B2R-40]